MKKVYCNTCKYYWNSIRLLLMTGNYPQNPHKCEHKTNLKTKFNAINNLYYYKKSADELNKSNNCKNYKRSWYKFWVI